MKQNTQPIQLTVYRDGQPDEDYIAAQPSYARRAAVTVVSSFTRVIDYITLEIRMWAFDVRMGTNYRTIRHELIAQKKRSQFERRIGLVRINQV